MSNLNTTADGQKGIEPIIPGERFQGIKEMIHLPEDEVSATFEPHEADDHGLPLMLMLITGVCIIGGSVMALLYFTVGSNVVDIIMGTHFLK